MADPLLERERELAEAARLLDAARGGDGGVLLFEGPAGIGKTALLEGAAEMGSGLRILRGTGGEIESELSFGLVRDMLDPVLHAAPAARRRRWLGGAAAPAAAILGGAAGPPPEDAAVAYALYWLLSAIAEDEPLLLLADDLHWSDRSSLRWLVYLARRIEGLSVAVLAAARPTDPLRPGSLARLAAADGVTVRRLGPLSREATSDVVASRSVEPPAAEFVRACHEVTGGNPLLLRELLKMAGDATWAFDADGAVRIKTLAGPRLCDAVIGRIGRLDPAAARLARAVAVLGDGCEINHAAALAGITEADALAAVPALVAASVLGDRPRLGFEHALLRAAVYSELSAPVRAGEHARAAALLHAAEAGAETVAGHLLAAGTVPEPWARDVLSAAARAALARGAPDSAAPYLRSALAAGPTPPQRATLVRALGNALVRLGDPEALGVLGEALELARDPEARLGIVEESFDPLVAMGHAPAARRLLLGVLRDDGGADPETATRLSAQLTMVRALDGSGEGDELVEALRARAETLDVSTLAGRYAAAALATLAALCDGTAAEAGALAHLAVGAATHDADARVGRPLYVALLALALAGEVEPALTAAGRALEIARERGSLMGRGMGLAWRSLLHVLAGNVEGAENDARTALHVLADTYLTVPQAGVTSALAWALIERGELEEAQTVLDASPETTGWGGAVFGCFQAQLQLARHDYPAALAELAEIETWAAQMGWRSGAALPWRALAGEARWAAGDASGARKLAHADLAEAERFGSEGEIGRALRLLARTTDGTAGAQMLEDSAARLRADGVGLELARTLVDQGAALRRSGERARSRTPLIEGMELAHASGATALVERARTELRAAGARPRSVVRSGVDALTPSEHRVASLAAGGLSNAQIAQELFVTVRTVEMHLTNCYRKLDVASRGALPTTLSFG